MSKPMRKYIHSDSWCSGHFDANYDPSDPNIVFLDEEYKPKKTPATPHWAITEETRHKGIGFKEK